MYISNVVLLRYKGIFKLFLFFSEVGYDMTSYRHKMQAGRAKTGQGKGVNVALATPAKENKGSAGRSFITPE
ncbi:MAG: hypothetical protein BGP14_21550 [Sphingobacteriales bacterium 44-15]|nr:MAG: hypothetical protein BGP14_21550 [Sphingobacteriales bacterium 44-15]